MRRRMMLAALVMAGLCMGCNRVTTISGRVLDDSGVPVKGAAVKVEPAVENAAGVQPQSVVSNDVGDFDLRISHPGSVTRFKLSTSLTGYQGAQKELTDGSHNAFVIQMRRDGGTKEQAEAEAIKGFGDF